MAKKAIKKQRKTRKKPDLLSPIVDNLTREMHNALISNIEEHTAIGSYVDPTPIKVETIEDSFIKLGNSFRDVAFQIKAYHNRVNELASQAQETLKDLQDTNTLLRK